MHPDGSVFVAGSSFGPFALDGFACSGYAARAFVLKLRPDGQTEWLRCYDAPSVGLVTSMVVTADAVVLGGECHVDDIDSPEMYLARIDPLAGAMDASACLGDGVSARVAGLALAGDKLVVVANFQGLVLFTEPLAAVGSDILVARLDLAAWTQDQPLPWEVSAQYGGPGFRPIGGLAQAADGSLAIVGRADADVECDDGDGMAAGGSRALFTVFRPSGGGYVRTTSLCYGDDSSPEGLAVHALPAGGFVWTGWTYGRIFAPPHRLEPEYPTMFAATWIDGAGITASWMPETGHGEHAVVHDGLAADPLGVVFAGEYSGDPVFFPGDTMPAGGWRFFVLQTAPDLTFDP